MFKEFKEFALRGNVVDLAVGIVIGAAFNRIIGSLVDNVLMPPLGLLRGGLKFEELFVTLGRGEYPTLAAAREAGAATLNYGLFIAAIIDFLLIALVLFLVVRQINRLRNAPKVDTPTTKKCPFCVTPVALAATRCPACTSELAATG